MDENGRKLLKEMASYKDYQMTWESMSESIRRKMASFKRSKAKT